MNNVIVLLIDSVFSECLGKNKTQISSTPFIDELVKESVFAPNIYSFGPYTDAATKGLYCGNRTLDDYGYYFGLNSSEYNHFKLFKENGYETYGIYYPYYLLSSKIEKNIDHSIYTSGFKYISVWGGKYEYYAKIKEQRQLTDLEYDILEKCVELVFDCWMNFYNNVEKYPESRIIVKELINEELNATGCKGLRREFKKYLNNKREYIDELLMQGMQHPLAQVNEFDYGKKEDIEFVKKIYAEYKKEFSNISKVNLGKNLKNNFINIKKSKDSIISYLKTHDITELRYFGNYGMLMLAMKMMKERSLKPQWQDLASLDKQIEALFSCLENRDSTKPFYASLHALEPHHNVSFFSFDSFDDGKIAEEIEYIKPLIKGCGADFSGNLLYQLSLRYVDLCVKRLFRKLEEKDMLETTTVMLVADHGSSYFFNPVRTRVVNTFHKENYNIPLLIWQKKAKKEYIGKYEKLYSSDDVFPTLCDLLGLEAPKQFTGKSIVSNKDGREYIITEYMGPGVPDMISKEVWISIRNKYYVIAYKNKISQPLDIYHPYLIYDLQKDPKEINNWVNIVDINKNKEIQNMVGIIEKRYRKIQIDTNAFLRELKDFSIIDK